MAIVPPDIRHRKYKVICPWEPLVLNSDVSSSLVLPSCQFITFPAFAPTGIPVPGHFLRYHLVPASLCLPDHRSHGLAFLRHPASSPVGSAPHTSRLQPASFLPGSKFPPAYNNQLTLHLPHRGWGNHSRPRSMVPRSFDLIAQWGYKEECASGSCLQL